MEIYESGKGAVARLKDEVLTPGLCTGCGACIGYCPYIKSYGERVGVIDNCKICEGVCYRVCPRCPTDYQTLRKEIYDSLSFDPVLGVYSEIKFARSGQERFRTYGQYGGVVSALSHFALKNGKIDCALMTGGGLHGAIPALVSSAVGVLECAGSKYTASPTLRIFQEALEKGYENIGIIGRPCQVTASRKMQRVPEINGQKISLVIGLFCMESFSPEFYKFIAEKHLDGYDRMDIPKDVQFQGAEGEVFIPFTEIRKFIRDACLSCYDPLSEFADVSVGSTEYDPGWNTVITRTARGAELMKEAVAQGIIEIKPYPVEILPLLRKAVFNKRKRVLERPDAAYLNLPKQEKDYFLSSGGDA